MTQAVVVPTITPARIRSDRSDILVTANAPATPDSIAMTADAREPPLIMPVRTPNVTAASSDSSESTSIAMSIVPRLAGTRKLAPSHGMDEITAMRNTVRTVTVPRIKRGLIWLQMSLR